MVCVGLCLFVAACFDKEPEQRKAYMEFLQTRLVDSKDDTVFPIPTARQEESFGPYADSFKIMQTFFRGMNERTGVGHGTGMRLPDAPALIADPALLARMQGLLKDLYAKQDALNKAFNAL